MSNSEAVVGLVQFDLFLPGCHSLKERRNLLQSIRARIRNQFNVSVAEVGSSSSHRRAVLAVACVSFHQSAARKLLDEVDKLLLGEPEIEILDSTVEFF